MNTQDRYFNQLAEAGRAVVERRLQLELSQAALASAAGVDAKTLRSLERGERWPQDTSRAKVERALGWKEGTLHALFVGDFLWREIDTEEGRAGGLIYLRIPEQESPKHSAPVAEEPAPLDPAAEESALGYTASELAALLVTRSQALERRVRQLEHERNELRNELDTISHRTDQDHDDSGTASMGSDAQRDGVTTAEGLGVAQVHPSTPETHTRRVDGSADDDLIT